MTVFLTRRCNARCPFCFYVTDTNPDRPEGPELSLTELEKTARNTGSLLWLAFSGGEIFLRPDLEEIVEAFYRHCRPAIILLPSNGIATETIVRQVGEIVRRCPRSTIVVKLSLDGPPPLHDALRRVPGAYDRMRASLAGLGKLAARHANLEVGINSVLCSANQDRLDETIEQVRTLNGVRTHTVSLVRGDLANPELRSVKPERYGQIAEKLREALQTGTMASYRFAGARLKAAQDILQRRFILQTLKEGRRIIPCFAGRLTGVVTETGHVYPCESFRGRLGNLRENDYDLQRLLARPQARRIIDSIRRGSCHCTHECYMMMNILFNGALLPRLLLQALRLPRSAAPSSGTPNSVVTGERIVEPPKPAITKPLCMSFPRGRESRLLLKKL